jgi:hypothetical protein
MALDELWRAEDDRWEKERKRLQAALRRTRDEAGKDALTIAISVAKNFALGS